MSNLIPTRTASRRRLAGLKFGSFGVKVCTSMLSKGKVFQLKNFGLPVIRTVDDFAEHTRLSPQLIRYLSYRANHLYRRYGVPKKDGTLRIIAQPARELKALQGWILRNILDKLSSSENCKGFERGYSILDNAAPHVGANFVLNLDLKDFFPSIKAEKVYGIFSSIGYDKKIAAILTNLTVYAGRLPQGAPTSPKLANLICMKLDARIQGYASPKGLVYTRYADDISLSGHTIKKIMNARTMVDIFVRSEGLQINRKKTEIQGTRRCKKVTGLVLTSSGVGVGRELSRDMRAKLYHLFTDQSFEYSHVNGLLAYLYSVDKTTCRRIWTYIDKLSAKYPTSSVIGKLIRPKAIVTTASTKV
jgi:RNA-directed DNA polymerase